ncbi:cupin domain-containing protein [Roseibium hamelinense]|nr:cupin domain-containing protein [Roseibium hamelinense]
MSGVAALCLALISLGAGPVISADKSLTPDSKPGPAAPDAKPGSQSAKAAEDAKQTPYQTVRDVFEGSETVTGEVLAFPAGNPSVKAIEVTLAPGEETAWHQHGAPMFAYILQGELTVTYEEFGKKVYRAGDGLLEAMHVTHRGKNTGAEPVKVLTVFMLGEGDQATVLEKDPGDSREKVE